MSHDPRDRELLHHAARIAQLELRVEELAAHIHLLQRATGGPDAAKD